MRYHTWLVLTALSLIVLPACGQRGTIDKIAFGSCARQDRAQPVWDTIADAQPDVFLMIGDNMYADLERGKREITIADVDAAYAQFGAIPEFARFRQRVPIHATWDDHDFGLNDAGKELPFKAEAQQSLLDFWKDPADSPRRSREGVYGSWTYGPKGRRVQIILLDTRYFRDALGRHPEGRTPEHGPYGPSGDPNGTLLGESQWAWLEAKLREPADVRIIGSSIQVIAGEHGWEGWVNFPHERDQLYALIESTGASGVLFISGDRHHTELSCDRESGPYTLYDLTSTGMNNEGTGERDEPNRHRISKAYRDTNWGLIRIDWKQRDPLITLSTLDIDGNSLIGHQLPLSELRAPAP